MHRKSRLLIFLVLAGVLGIAGSAGAADTANKAEAETVKACQRGCGDPARTDPTRYERCMIDCRTKAAGSTKLKNDPRIH